MMKRMRPLSRHEVRQLDVQAASDLKLPTLILMENAGRGAADWLTKLASGLPDQARILVLCGPGNNGGDGGVGGRHLEAWGYPVQVVWFAHRAQLRGDAETQWNILERSGVDQTAWLDVHPPEPQPQSAELDSLLSGADWLVDGLLGTGLVRPIEGALRAVVEAMNRAGKPILALDLPSGLDADTGAPLGVSVRARATATFVAPKLGFTAPGAADYTGEVAVIDIGLPRCLLEPFEQ
jgi:NAD(P)H-hydrate epimerase